MKPKKFDVYAWENTETLSQKHMKMIAEPTLSDFQYSSSEDETYNLEGTLPKEKLSRISSKRL